MTDERKVQLALAIIIIALTVGAHKLVLSDRINTNRRLSKSNEKIQDELYNRNRNWTLNPNYLSKLNNEYKRIRDNRFDQLEKVFVRSNNEFKKLYDPTNVGISVKTWRQGLMVFSFGEMYWDVKNSLKDRGVNLHESVLKMNDKEVVPRQRIYRKLAHLHVARELVLMAQKNMLILSHPQMTSEWKAENPGDITFTSEPAMVTMLEPRSYFVPPAGENTKYEAFVDEFPVEIRVRGRLGNVTRFLHQLTADNRFLPLDLVQIKAVGADKYIKFSKNMKFGENKVEARIVCSGFLVITDWEKLKSKVLKSKAKLGEHKGA